MRGADAVAGATAPPARRELVLVAALTLLALGLRAWHLSSAGLTQYDEGVYALTGLGLTDGTQPFRLLPGQEKFSPPVWFLLVALSFLVGGAHDGSAIAMNVLLGALTVPVLWWVGRRWFGAAAGAAAATLLALNETHVVLSRTALTDVAFTLVFIVAVAAVARALADGSTRAAVLAGLATGLAWNTKYHGWFALVIGAGIVVVRHWQGATRDDVRRMLRAFVIASVVAFACYLPWLVYIQTRPGALGGWSRYFATMLRIDWPGNFAQHVRQQLFLEGAWSRAALPLAIASAFVAHDGPARPSRATWITMLAIAVAALLTGEFVTMSLLSLAMVPPLVRRGRPADWALGGWILLWVVMAPIYHPYFRLLLPFIAVIALGAGAFVQGEIVARGAEAGDEPRATWRAAGAAFALAALVWVAGARMPDPSDPWRPTDDWRRAAADLASRIPAGARVGVVGEPPIAFYLQRAGYDAYREPRPEDIAAMSDTSWLVVGVYAERAPQLRDVFARRAAELESHEIFHVEPGELRLLDDSKPAVARAYRVAPDTTFDVTLLRLAPLRSPP